MIGAPPNQAMAQTQDQADYLSSLPDFPLMPGLREQDGTEVVFDKPGGRIVEASFGGAALPAEVRDYYLGALPALGWQIESLATDSLIFAREDERLVLTIVRQGGQTLVHLALEPIV